ncbi:MAG TPA: DUF6677 family protein [Terriglobia bacterium]|nr:DUF6677 family protein [Terriglobia bacterium]
MPKRVAEQEAQPKPAAKAAPKSEKAGVTPPGLPRLIELSVAAWLVPGLGHFLLGRRWRALILFASIVTMFVLGLAMNGEFFSTQSASYLETLGYFGELCVGAAMPVARFFGYPGGNPFFVSSDFGTAFLVSAGMLNALCVFDTYDIAAGRKP